VAAQESGWLNGQIVENAPDAIIMADREGSIRSWNAGAGAVFGYPAAEAAGQSLDLIIPEQFRTWHWNGFRKVMETGVTGTGQSCPLCQPSGRTRRGSWWNSLSRCFAMQPMRFSELLPSCATPPNAGLSRSKYASA
jgi:PAS domain S-box-containing protein